MYSLAWTIRTIVEKERDMDCKVKWVGPEGMSFVAETESGHAFVMDGAPDGGGRNLGPRPMETGRARPESETVGGGERDQAFAQQVLLGLDHARQDRDDHARLRDHRKFLMGILSSRSQTNGATRQRTTSRRPESCSSRLWGIRKDATGRRPSSSIEKRSPSAQHNIRRKK